MQTIELPANCDRAAAVELHPEFVAAIGDTPIAVDAAKVERMGLAIAQLLVSAERTGAGVVISNPSPAATDALGLAGLDRLLTGGNR